jgi:hypothetical protein
MLSGLAAQSAALSLSGATQRGFGSTLSSNGETPAAQNGATPAAADFNQYTEDYAAFCARPKNERVFYALRNGSIVANRLNSQDWKPVDLGNPPELPVLGGSHDGVPTISPIPNLAGDACTKPFGNRCFSTNAPNGIATPSSEFGIIGVRSAHSARGAT